MAIGNFFGGRQLNFETEFSAGRQGYGIGCSHLRAGLQLLLLLFGCCDISNGNMGIIYWLAKKL